ALAAAGAHAECEALNGTYRYEAVAPVQGRPRYLSDLTLGPERRRIIRTEAPVTRGEGLASSQPRSRPKVTHLAATGTLAAVARGATIEFRDATGKALATMGLGEGWACKGDALERNSEITHGLGNDIRTDRVQQRLAKAGRDLVYSETATAIDLPGAKPTRIEVRYAAVK
ncbi:MAG TPA: hypothetical protein VFP36_15835, partial [Usitatibacter sp.]|nr:hypothetical protein [Usitatibacter sp.]